MNRASALTVVAALLALASSAIAAQPDTPPAAPQSEPIVVIGQRQTEEAIRAFVEQMSVAPRATHQLATWGHTICTGVAGLHTRFAQFINDRIAQRAEAVGLDVGEPGCRANVLIAISDDPDAIARDLYDHHKTLLGYYMQRGHGTLGRRALLQDFVNSMAPVRWWHVSRTITSDGDVIDEPLDGREAQGMAYEGMGDPTKGAPVVQITSGHSRLRASTHQSFGVAFVIVDARKLHGVSFEALADYIAMVTLAQLDPRADVSSYPTILNTFAQHGTPAAMTDWDVAYLHGLYGATQDARNAQSQEAEITHSIVIGLRQAPPSGTPGDAPHQP